MKKYYLKTTLEKDIHFFTIHALNEEQAIFNFHKMCKDVPHTVIHIVPYEERTRINPKTSRLLSLFQSSLTAVPTRSSKRGSLA
ncbi:hypothetical protein [Bacillus luti]|nr:hypothetical protein [Bacillus cereus]HDR8328208.1 hypothetical protein [Bacillus cereus]HDR8335998.1 hypothetical protein [Bacillus cereus]